MMGILQAILIPHSGPRSVPIGAIILNCKGQGNKWLCQDEVRIVQQLLGLLKQFILMSYDHRAQ